MLFPSVALCFYNATSSHLNLTEIVFDYLCILYSVVYVSHILWWLYTYIFCYLCFICSAIYGERVWERREKREGSVRERREEREKRVRVSVRGEKRERGGSGTYVCEREWRERKEREKRECWVNNHNIRDQTLFCGHIASPSCPIKCVIGGVFIGTPRLHITYKWTFCHSTN